MLHHWCAAMDESQRGEWGQQRLAEHLKCVWKRAPGKLCSWAFLLFKLFSIISGRLFPPLMLYSNIKPRGFCFEMLPWMHPFHHPLTSVLFICCHGYSATFLLVPPPQVLIAKSRCCRNVLEHRELVISAPPGHSSEDPRHLWAHCRWSLRAMGNLQEPTCSCLTSLQVQFTFFFSCCGKWKQG